MWSKLHPFLSLSLVLPLLPVFTLLLYVFTFFLAFSLSLLLVKHYSGLNLVLVLSNICHYTSHTSLSPSVYLSFPHIFLCYSYVSLSLSLCLSFQLSLKDLWRGSLNR